MNNRFAWALVVAALTGCSGTTTAVNSTSQANPLDSEEDALLYQLNLLRDQAGIADALTTCKSLNVSASKHADDMRDQGYLAEKDPDGGSVRTRTCAEGYTPGCSDASKMAELVASGIDEGKKTLIQWSDDPKTNSILLDPKLHVAGVGRSLAIDGARWTLDLGELDDPTCH